MTLKAWAVQDDLLIVTVKEELIKEALLKCGPEELDKILTAIEGYRTCVSTAERLQRSPSMQEQRNQALECAGYCEATLREFVTSGILPHEEFPVATSGSAHLRLSIRW